MNVTNIKKALWLLFFCIILVWIPIIPFDPGTEWLRALGGISLGLFIVSILVGIFGALTPFPFIINKLVNNPKGKKGEPPPPILPNRFHMFTFIEHGRTLAKVRGTKPAGYIIDDPERKFRGKGDKETSADHWWVDPGDGQPTLPPLDILNPISWWAHWVYKKSGAIFVGIFFTRIRVKMIQRVKEVKNEKGIIEIDVNTKLPVLQTVEDWTDHARTKPHPWLFTVPSVNPSDKGGISFRGFLIIRIVNPYLNDYNQERSDTLITGKIKNYITAWTSTKKFDEVFSMTKDTMFELANYLKENLNKTLNPPEDQTTRDKKGAGIEILEVHITDRSPEFETPEDKKAFTAKLRASQEKDAKIELAEGVKQEIIKAAEAKMEAGFMEAAVKERDFEVETGGLEKRMGAIRKDPEIGMRLAELDAQEDTVKGSKNATVVVQQGGQGGGHFDAVTFSKLNELIDSMENLNLSPPKKQEEKPAEEKTPNNKPERRGKKK